MDQTDMLLNDILKKLPTEIIHIIVENYEYQYYFKDMVTCENCGNMWDGFAQCNCYMFDLDGISSNQNLQQES